MTKAIIIAGGKGESLRPLTFESAKPLIKIRGETLIDHHINLYWNAKVYEVWLNLGYLYNQIKKEYPTMPFILDVHTEDNRVVQLGTGGWLNRIARTEGKNYWYDNFFASNADNLANINLQEVMDQHLQDKNVVTIVCTHVNDIRPYGSVAIKNRKITNFEEKKKTRTKKSGFVNAGYYVFSPKVFAYVEKLGIDIDSPMSLEKDLFPVLAKEGVLGAYVSNGQWFDTSSFANWEKAVKEWKGL